MNYRQDASDEWRVGEVILKLYEVKEVFRQGGMGLVYRVRHRNWDVDLAVKRPRPRYFRDQVSKAAFMREAESWVRLGLHTHVTSCYYVRNLKGVPTVFAEFIEGGSLHDWIRSRKLYRAGSHQALKRILSTAIQLAWGLHYAHERGLVHQDVKPANVMMTPEGVAKVTDFGLAQARSLAANESNTAPGKSVMVPGAGLMTIAYASPEQRSGRPLTRKTDVWSWGVSVLEMFTGGVFWAEGAYIWETLEEYLGGGLASEDLPRMPGAVADLLRRCFEYDPDKRPRDMLEVGLDLGDIYLEVVGRPYPRPAPQAAAAVADSLNNRAVSLLDLNREEEAVELWSEALRAQPYHPESTYNRGLTMWRTARLTDAGLLQRLEEVKETHAGNPVSDYLLGLVHLERGDAAAAAEHLREGGESAEVRAALAAARRNLPAARRLLQIFRGHREAVTVLRFCGDGRHVQSGSFDGTIRFWKIETGRCVRKFKIELEGGSFQYFSRDGQFVLGESGQQLKLWDIYSGRCLRALAGHVEPINASVLSRDERYALSGSNDYTLRLWDLNTRRCLRTFRGHFHQVLAVCLSRDMKYAVSGSEDTTLKLWEVETGRCLRTFVGHEHRVQSVALSLDGRYALSGSTDETLKVWDVSTGRCLRTLSGHGKMVDQVALSGDGRLALSGGWLDSSLQLWEVATGRCVHTFAWHVDEGLRGSESLHMSPEGLYALSGGADALVRLWWLGGVAYSAPHILSHVVTSEKASQSGTEYGKNVASAREAYEGGDFVAAARHVRQARSQLGYARGADALEIWGDLYSRLPRKTLNGAWEKATLEGHDSGVLALSLSPDGRYAVSGGHDHVMRVWDVESGRLTRTLAGHKHIVDSAAFSYDGKRLLSSGWDRTLKLWSTETWRCLRTFEPYTDVFRSSSLSGDSRYALSGSQDGKLQLWEVKTGRLVRTCTGHKKVAAAVALSYDGRHMLSASLDRTLKFWDVASGRCIRTFTGHGDWVGSVCLDMTGRYVLSGGGDSTLKLWDVDTGNCLRTFVGHQDTVQSVCFSADARHALSGSNDRTMKLWEVETGRCLRTFVGHVDTVTVVSISRDGRHAISGSVDKKLKLWVLDWELEERRTRDWDEGARPYLRAYLSRHVPYAATLPKGRKPTQAEVTVSLTRRGRPKWGEDDFRRLLHTLGCVGYGWLHPEEVRRELEQMVAEWN